MDAWNPDQLKRMQLGGNGKFNAFLSKYGVAKNTEIKRKYNTPAAEFYREKIRAELEGRAYTPPAPSESVMSQPPARIPSSSRSSPGPGTTDWGGWEDDTSSGNYAAAALAESAANKDSFFAGRVAENASRPDHLPPSQGGKYVGFGSTPIVNQSNNAGNAGVDDVTRLLNKGLTGLGSFASAARERAVEVQARYNDGTLGDQTQQAAERAKEATAKGWGFLKGAYARAASQLEATAAANGYKVDLGARRVSESLSNDPTDGGGSSRYGGFGSSSYEGAPPRAASAASSRGYAALSQAGDEYDRRNAYTPPMTTKTRVPSMTHAASAPAFASPARQASNGGGFGGFDDDADQWGGDNAWQSAPAANKTTQAANTNVSLLDADPSADEDHQDWGKW